MIYFLLFCLLTILGPFASASEQLDLASQIELTETQHPASQSEVVNQALSQWTLTSRLRWTQSSALKITLAPQISLEPNNNSETERTFIDLNEANLLYTTDKFSLRAGNNIFSWGVTDGYNPLDNLNIKQYFNPLKSKKMGATSLVFSQSLENWDYEVIYFSRSRGALLPGTESRWLPREIFLPQDPANTTSLLLPQTLRYHYGKNEYLNEALVNNWAFRLQRRGDSTDISLSYYEGLAPLPVIQPQVTGEIVQVSPKTVIKVDPDITLNLQNYKLRQAGFTLVNPLGNYLVKFASSYSQSLGTHPLLPGWSHENVFAIESSRSLGSNGFLVGFLQHSWLLTQHTNDSNLSLSEIFRNSWMLGAKLNWNEVWDCSFSYLYDKKHQSSMQQLGVSRTFKNNWKLNISTNQIQGGPEAPLGVFEKNDSFSISILRQFSGL